VGGLAAAENLSYEEMLVVTATLEYQEVIDSLREQAESLYANPPMEAEHDNGVSDLDVHKRVVAWNENLCEVEAQLQTEMDCWWYPLDHERGEQLLSKEGDRGQVTGDREEQPGRDPNCNLKPETCNLAVPEARA
jgi:hypothetical protein